MSLGSPPTPVPGSASHLVDAWLGWFRPDETEHPPSQPWDQNPYGFMGFSQPSDPSKAHKARLAFGRPLRGICFALNSTHGSRALQGFMLKREAPSDRVTLTQALV